MHSRNWQPELLAPAGDWECAKAAVENGADAIYFGLDRFNARMRARNFTEADLPSLMAFLHRRGVRGYVSFNTLVFADEVEGAEDLLRTVIAAGVDAAIVQDVGVCRLIRALSPDFPIHASTQMTISSAAGLEIAQELGCELVVLARECSLREIESIQQSLATAPFDGCPAGGSPGGTTAGHEAGSTPCSPTTVLPVPLGESPAPPVPSRLPGTLDCGVQPLRSLPRLEVFVHGALCVAYSGQCLTSESLGGRSANRGECAQACRMPYELIADGQPVPLGDRRYLLSPQDLAGIDVLPELIGAGVASFKIEGRLKSPEYVANITRLYREALDRNLAGLAKSESVSPFIESQSSRYEMEMAFSRGLYPGWLRGVNNQELVHARFGKKRGVFLGEVSRVHGGRAFVRLVGPLKPGDGVVFDAGAPDQPEEGGRVYALEPRDTETALSFGRGDVDFRRVHVGDKLWKTSDPALDARLRQSFSGDTPRFQRPVQFAVHGRAGEPLTLIARDDLGHMAQAQSSVQLCVANHQPLAEDRLRQQLGRLGGTPFRLGGIENRLEGEVLLPLSELNRLRREVVQQLESQRAQPPRWTWSAKARNGTVLPTLLPTRSGDAADASSAELSVLVRSQEQLEAVLASGARTVYCEFADPKQYRDAVARFRTWQQSDPVRTGAALFVAPPRITKPGEDWILRQVRASEADGYLVRNYDHLRYFAGCRCVGDYSFNVANPLSAAWFKTRFGLERLTASYDLNNAQLEALLQGAPPDWFEITIHQHMPMFHMEHCIFCAFLSDGTDYRNCGRPCDHHAVQLRDRVGAKHPVLADAGCRNTVFNALAQTGAEYVGRLLTLGTRRFRLEFLDESPALVVRTIHRYDALLHGALTGSQLWRELKLHHQLGVTRGTLDRPAGKRSAI